MVSPAQTVTAARKRGRKRPPPSGAAADDERPRCWICLGSDADGGPLRRDCSCRGASGFAHLSCIVDYAERITRDDAAGAALDSGRFILAWTACPNCRQDYEHGLAADLVARCNSFVEEQFPGDIFLGCHAVYLKLRKLAIREENKKAGKEVANEVISMVERMRARNPSLPRAILYFEIAAYETLALFAEREGSKKSLGDAVGFHTKCRDIYALIGIPTDLAHAEACIAQAKSKRDGDRGAWTREDTLKDCMDYYKESAEESGEDSCVTMISAFRLADALRAAHRGVEAERTIRRLAGIACRVHGEGHDFTRDVTDAARRFRKRYVFLRGRRGEHFAALRFKGRDRCVVRGPIAKPRKVEEEKEFAVHIHEVRPALGTPVICYGLGLGSALEGKLGEVRSQEKGAHKYRVHFEDKNVEPSLVHPKNMRIIFDLPEKEWKEE